VWNRSSAVAQRHAARYGSNAVPQLSGLAHCDVVFTCLPTSKEVAETLAELAPHLRRGAVVIDCTSGEPKQTRKRGETLLATHGVGMLDAPVSGGPAGAEQGILTSMCGGTERDFQRVRPLLARYSKSVFHIGPLGAGHATKAFNNSFNASHLLICAEGVAALIKMGVDPRRALGAINESSGRSLQSRHRFPLDVLPRKFNYGFKLGLMRKDVQIANDILDEHVPDAAFIRTTLRHLDAAVTQCGADVDYTEAVKVIEEHSGVLLKDIDEEE
jgi:3-hydroxyisobutyrate dehydrogenase